MSTPGNNLRWRLHTAKFRDKGFQRFLASSSEYNVFSCPLKDLGLYINITNPVAQDILKWRLHIHK
jgi:hypothetical protein